MQLKEKKSSMERDKRKLESELEKQLQKIGKQVFLQVVQKKPDMSMTLFSQSFTKIESDVKLNLQLIQNKKNGSNFFSNIELYEFMIGQVMPFCFVWCEFNRFDKNVKLNRSIQKYSTILNYDSKSKSPTVHVNETFKSIRDLNLEYLSSIKH